MFKDDEATIDDFFTRYGTKEKDTEVVKKFSIEDCYKIKLWCDMSDSQFDELRNALAHFGQKGIFYCSAHIRNKHGKKTEKKLEDAIGMKSIPGGGCVTSIKKVIVFLIALLNPDVLYKESSTWKLMIDGRPKGKFNFL